MHSRSYGEVPLATAALKPWRVLCVDLIGPYTLKIVKDRDPKTGKSKVIRTVQLMVLTMIDPVTNLVEIARQTRKTTAETVELFRNNWLCRYP